MLKEYLEAILHREVQITQYENSELLPLSITGAYDLCLLTIGGLTALIASPREKASLVAIRKHQRQMTVYTGLPCILHMVHMNYYMKDAMVKEGIPFVWEGHQIYLPFIGVLLENQQRKPLKTCTQISYLTQRLLLTALYQGWEKVTVSKAAVILDVSKMSVTRCFDELEALGIPYLNIKNRARYFTADKDKKKMWEELKGFLRNPIIASYAVKEVPDKTLLLSGQTALAHYSLLDDGPNPVFAVLKKDLHTIDLSYEKLTPAGEEPECVIQELGYCVPYENNTAVDPLTVILSLSEEEKDDPRINIAIDEMLEEHLW